MLKIGEFSKLAQISIRMLRFYDQNDLLKPAFTDPDSGYRYYSVEQLPVAAKINSLKMLGFGTAGIKSIIDNADENSLKQILSLKRKELEDELEGTKNKLFLVNRALGKVGEKKMTYDVTLKDIPEKIIAFEREIIPFYENEGNIFSKLMDTCIKNQFQFEKPIFSGTLYHDQEFKESDADIEAFVAIEDKDKKIESDKIRILPSHQIASCIVKGSYDQFAEVNHEIASWITENGYIFDGPMYNLYYISPAQTDDPNEYLTEVCYPVRKVEMV